MATALVYLASCSGGDSVQTSSPAFAFEPVAVTATPQDAPERTGLEQSPLTLEAAFVLKSSDPDFGGLSGLWISDDSQRLVAVGDRGDLWRAELDHDATGRLLDVRQWTKSAAARRSASADWRRSYDAEALAGLEVDAFAIAYEGQHQILTMSLADPARAPAFMPVPSGLGGPSNSGIETLATLEDGRLLAIAERVGAWGGVGLSAWLIDRDRIDDLIYLPTDGFAPTGGDRLDDRFYVVERRFSLLGGFKSKIKVVPTHQIFPGRQMEGRLLAAFQWGDLGENFEGLVAKRAPDGRTLLYLIADDNFSFLQRTVLLQLSLPEPSQVISANTGKTVLLPASTD